jgi:BirA family biotin operon repressor/biotin-[acetyl-CoA-carboxylase] ligase
VNDVLVDGLKIGGFLSQSFTGDQSGECYCLIGFGINVNNLDFPFALQGSATSLKQQTGQRFDLEEFTYRFLAKLAWNLGLLYHQEKIALDRYLGEEDQPVHPLLQRWLALSDSIGRPVVFGFDVVKKPQYRAVVEGLSADGGLRLILEDGSATTEYSGEIRYLD